MAAGGRLAAAPQSDMIKQLDICSFNLSAHILCLPDLLIIKKKKQATVIQEIMITNEEPPLSGVVSENKTFAFSLIQYYDLCL